MVSRGSLKNELQTQGSQKAIMKLLPGTSVILGLNWRRICFYCQRWTSLGRSSTHMGLSMGLPPARDLDSPWEGESRQSESTQNKAWSFYNLLSEAKIQETGIISGCLGGCLPIEGKVDFRWMREEIYSLLGPHILGDRSMIVWRLLRILLIFNSDLQHSEAVGN